MGKLVFPPVKWGIEIVPDQRVVVRTTWEIHANHLDQGLAYNTWSLNVSWCYFWPSHSPWYVWGLVRKPGQCQAFSACSVRMWLWWQNARNDQWVSNGLVELHTPIHWHCIRSNSLYSNGSLVKWMTTLSRPPQAEAEVKAGILECLVITWRE